MEHIRKSKQRTKLALSALAASASLMLAACTAPASTDPDRGSQADTTVKQVGVVQFAQHSSLDNCYNGLVAGLAASGYSEEETLEIDLQNANADPNMANQIAESFAARGFDLIIGIATPAAQAAYNAARPEGIPVLFSAVTDPVLAGLQQEDGSNQPGITGTSDMLPIRQQLEMIRAFQPDAATIGILFTTSEANSLSAIAAYEELAPEFGFTIETQGVNTAQEIPMAADALLPKIDALTNLTDNTVVQNMPVILDKTMQAGIPYYGSEIEQVTNGCVAAEGLDYVALGYRTGEMGAAVLDGQDPASIPIEVIEASTPSYNPSVMEKMGLTLPDEYADRIEDAAGTGTD